MCIGGNARVLSVCCVGEFCPLYVTYDCEIFSGRNLSSILTFILDCTSSKITRFVRLSRLKVRSKIVAECGTSE